MNKLVSIILPTYNGEKYLRQSIESCLKQTYNNIELIVVNDCSSDDSENIIQSYNDNRIRYIKNSSNLKLPRSLNVGFSEAKGDYLTWTSDDNFYDFTAIQKMVNALESLKVDLVCAPYYTIDNTGKITGERLVGIQENILIDNVVKACFLYKKEVHQKLNGYNPNLFLVEDYDFWIRAAFENFQFYQLKEKLYYYRFHENSLTDSRRDEIAVALYKLLSGYLEIFQKAGKSKYLGADLYLRIAKLAVFNKDLKNATIYLRKAIRINPLLVFSSLYVKLFIKIKLN